MGNIPATKRWARMVEEASALLTSARDEMQEWVEERSEAWAESEKADDWMERIDSLDEAIDACDQVEFRCGRG